MTSTATITIGTDKQIAFASKTQAKTAARIMRGCDELIMVCADKTIASQRLAAAIKERMIEVLATEPVAAVWLDSRDAMADADELASVVRGRITSNSLIRLGLSARWICETKASISAEIVAEEAALAAAEAEVEAAQTAEAAEIAASEDAIETATETVSDAAPAQTLSLYRLTVRCSDCCKRTKSLATEIAHYPWCNTLAQDPELLRTLQDKIAASRIKRRETKAAKLNAKIDDLREAFSAIYASVGGNSALGIHKVSGSTGLHTVRAYEGTCTCPGHKAHGHCKHVRLVRDARDAMQAIKRQLQDTSRTLLAMAERGIYATCES